MLWVVLMAAASAAMTKSCAPAGASAVKSMHRSAAVPAAFAGEREGFEAVPEKGHHFWNRFLDG